jgi:hypothetical protein
VTLALWALDSSGTDSREASIFGHALVDASHDVTQKCSRFRLLSPATISKCLHSLVYMSTRTRPLAARPLQPAICITGQVRPPYYSNHHGESDATIGGDPFRLIFDVELPCADLMQGVGSTSTHRVSVGWTLPPHQVKFHVEVQTDVMEFYHFYTQISCGVSSLSYGPRTGRSAGQHPRHILGTSMRFR